MPLRPPMPRPRSLAIAILALLPLAPAAPRAAHDETLVAGLARVDAAMAAGRWEPARRLLLDLVEARPGDPDLPLVLDGLRARLATCTFRAAYRPPSPAQLVRGELLEWDERTGRLAVRYRAAALRRQGDDPAPAAVPEELRTPPGDLHPASEALLHPARFDGPFSIEIRGRHLDALRVLPPAWRPRSAAVLLLMDDGRRVEVLAGFPGGGHGRIVRVGYGDAYAERRPLDDLARDRLELPVDGRYRFRVAVDRASITATLDGRPYLQARKEPEMPAGVGLLAFPHVTEVVIAGDTDGAWLAGLRAEDERRARELFDADYDPDAELPAWLVGPRRP